VSYSGPPLELLFPTQPSERASRLMAALGRDELHRLAVMNTPIDDNPYRSIKKPPRGETRRRWEKHPVERTLALSHEVSAAGLRGFVYAYEGRVSNSVPWIGALESGSGLWGPKHAKYPIRPKNPGGMLRWRDRKTGEFRTAKLVMHPGIHGQHMMFYAAGMLDHTAEALLEPVAIAWAGEIETHWRLVGRIHR